MSSSKFTEAQLEAAIIELLGEAGYPHTYLSGRQVMGETIEFNKWRGPF